MLISIGSIPFISHLFKSLSKSYTFFKPKFYIPFSINSYVSPTKTYFTINPLFHKTGIFQSILLLCGSLSLGLQAVLGRKNLHILDYYIKVFFSFALFLLSAISMMYNQQLDDIVNFCNKLCSFERTFIHLKGSLNKTETSYWNKQILRKVVLLFTVAFVTAFQVDNVIVVMVPVLIPKIAWNILPQISSISSPYFKAVELILRFYVNLVIWIIGVNTTMMAVQFSFLILQFALLCGMDFVKRLNENGIKSSNKVNNIRLSISAYRSLKLLSVQYNYIHGKALMCPLVLLSVFTFILSIYLVVIHGTEMSLVYTLMFLSFLSFDAILQTVMFRIPAEIYTLSNYFIRKELHFARYAVLKHGNRGYEVAEFKRMIASLTPIKITFFGNNYFESCTPLIMTQFTLSQATDLIVMSSKTNLKKN